MERMSNDRKRINECRKGKIDNEDEEKRIEEKRTKGKERREEGSGFFFKVGGGAAEKTEMDGNVEGGWGKIKSKTGTEEGRNEMKWKKTPKIKRKMREEAVERGCAVPE